MTPSLETFQELHRILEERGCTYVSDIDESYIGELLMKPGEHRLRILLWVVGQIHESAEKILNSLEVNRTSMYDSTIDHRIQILTSLLSAAGLCRPVEVNVIRGEVPANRHLGFWKGVINILKFSDGTKLDSTFSSECRLLDNIHAQDSDVFGKSFRDEVCLLPPNLHEEMKMMSPKRRKVIKQSEKISAELTELSKCLDAEQAHLIKVEKEAMYSRDDDDSAIKSVCCKLGLSLGDLDQMITTFDQVFQNSYYPYCNKEQEEFSQLGSLFQILAKQFSYVVERLDNLHTIMESNEILCDCASLLCVTKSRVTSGRDLLYQARDNLEALAHTMEKQTLSNDNTEAYSQFHVSLSAMCSLR